MVIRTSSSRLWLSCLYSVARDALTVNNVWFCSTFENENTVDCFSTAAGGGGGACFLTCRACQACWRYTTPTIPARNIATPADHLAYFAASLVRMVLASAAAVFSAAHFSAMGLQFLRSRV